MLRDIINGIDSFSSKEKEILVSIVEDVYFYWDKFEILDDAIEIIHNFYKPKPITYYSPLSDFVRLDKTINYNAYVVAFINLTCFFESNKKRKDDRFLYDFIQRCKTNVSILYQLKVELNKINHLTAPYNIEYFIDFINEIEENINTEIKKDYIMEIKKYRNKILSHHTSFIEQDIDKKVPSYLMNAKRFLNTLIQNQLGEIITQKYNPRQESISNCVDSLRKITKPKLEDIIQGKITFPLLDNERLKLVLEDDIFETMVKKLSTCIVNKDTNGGMVITFEIRKSFYERTLDKGIDTKFLNEALSKLVKKYNIEGLMVNEEIIDH